ncbi:MAG TPA: DUF1501 domain-containing protein, partial [Planctomycetaceae bacterium]|nr:DUF1501 domain-containing protein [Planctomycetaceae bacterium]
MSSSHDSVHGCTGFRSMPRRQVLQAGVLGTLGLSMADLFRLQAEETSPTAGASGKKIEPRAMSVIQINLPGGFPHHESFDPKPEAPVEYRGSFGVVKTKTGDVFSV